MLIVSEAFGPTVQGEGPSLGRRAAFIRLARCNLSCGWCDSRFSWDWSQYDPEVVTTTRDIDDVACEIEAMAVGLVVITGGEPLLQQSHLPPLLSRLRASGHEIEIETAGTIAPSVEVIALVDRWNVSPKLANSGNSLERRYKPEVLAAFAATGRAVFKFVVQDLAELDEVGAFGVEPVWIMPEGTDADTVIRRGAELADAVVARGWNLTTRLHILLWGDERGR